MRRLLFAVALPIVTLPLLAADETKANTLTPKEIADGWILLFDGETTFGWKSDGEVKANDARLGSFQFGLPEPDGERWAELAFTVQQKKTTIHQRGVKGGDKEQEIRWLANDNSVHVSFS